MTKSMSFVFCAVCACMLFALSCKKDNEKAPEKTAPELTTAVITSITANSAIGGGNITNNGGETVTASGICWSNTNQTPTVSNDSTKGSTTSGSFMAVLSNLNASSTYYVRAYAINSKGTGYGNVVTFSTGNGAPTATALTITGDAIVGEELTGSYTYSDPESNPESGTTFKWYVANDAAGAGETAIAGADQLKYTIQDGDKGKYIRFAVTPKSSAGNANGEEVKSEFFYVPAETITFTYNNAQVTYGVLVSATTGEKWLDRNLGATRAAQSVSDYKAYGDLFQWGRLADGHQLIARTNGTDAGATGVTGTTGTQSATDVPPTNKFFTLPDADRKYDWRNPSNENLWQGINGANNPCPAGFRVATHAEWLAEGITTVADGYAKLKLTFTGYREVRDLGAVVLSESYGIYWTSTAVTGSYTSKSVSLTTGEQGAGSGYRGNALACRCIKD